MKPRQNEAEYQAIKKVLLDSDIHSEKDIKLKTQGMMKAAKLYSVLGSLLMLTFVLILPRYSVFTILLFCLYMAWLWSSTLASKHYFQRYLQEANSEAQNK
ncbi:MAG: hypothetical protein ACRBEE_12555 [Arenicella sp.]